jgi:hypothetical protein
VTESSYQPIVNAEIISAASQQFSADIAPGLAQISALVQNAAPVIREKLQADGFIAKESSGSPVPVYACDGASFDKEFVGQQFSAVLAVIGRHSGEGAGWRHKSEQCVSPVDALQENRFAKAIRFALELELLSDAPEEGIVIADGSSTTFLWDTNNNIRALIPKGGEAPIDDTTLDMSKRKYSEIVKRVTRPADGGANLLIRALDHPAVIWMSKESIGQSLCNANKALFTDESGNFLRLNDRMLYSAILQEGERTVAQPMPTKLGIETKTHVTYREAEHREMRTLFHSCMKSIYYKPHGFQPCYRIEFNSDHYPEGGARFIEMLASIKEETNIVGFIEPRAQFFADAEARQIAPMLSRMLREAMASTNLFTENRTSR